MKVSTDRIVQIGQKAKKGRGFNRSLKNALG
jgi:hypothetical protein